MVQLDYPRFDPKKGWPKFWMEVAQWEKQRKQPKKDAILTFINDWLHLKKKNKFQSFYAFRNIFLDKLPNDEQSKKFLIENFEKYNELFKLDLEYDEKLFTRYNTLYMLKLMLKTLDYDLKKIEKIYKNDSNDKNDKKINKVRKVKIYTIIDNNTI